MAQKTFVDPIKYAVDKDLTRDQYNDIVLAVTDWFAQSRRTDEPAALARKALQECLDGKKADGSPWFEMALASLKARVRSKCLFDIESMQPLKKATDKQRERKKRERELAEKRRLASKEDPLIPEELRDEQKRLGAKKLLYGDDPKQLLSSKELSNWNKYKKAYIQQHPELSTASAEAELNQLCDFHVLSDRYRMRLLAGERIDPTEREKVGGELLRLKRSLGILPEQIDKRAKPKTEMTIAAAADKLEQGKWRELRLRYFVEEMMQLYQMYHTPSADGQDWQLNEMGLFALTKCRTCACASCGTRNFVGIKIEEVEQYLKDQGVLKVEEAGDAGAQAPTPAQDDS